MRVLLLELLLVSSLVGCGDNELLAQPDASIESPPDAPRDAPDSTLGPPLEERINAAVDRINGETCFTEPDTSECEWDDYEIRPAYFDMAVSTNESILIIDDFAEGTYPQFVRYRNRIRRFYSVDGQVLQPRDLSVRLPKRLGDSLAALAGPEFISASLLTAVGQAAGAVYSNVPLLFLGHGGVVFSHLVELAPEQPLVLVHSAGLLKVLPSLCDGVTPQKLTDAAAHFESLASSLSGVISANDVKFINASFGDTAQTLATDWSQTCTTPLPSPEVVRQLLHLYDPVYSVLFNTAGVITAHAGANLGDPADFPFDQPIQAYKNRVRVGFISSKNSGLNEHGQGTVMKSKQFPRDGDADVYVNWNCVEFQGCGTPRYELAGAFGLGAFSVPLMSSSYVNPLGLGRLINLRYAAHDNEAMNDSLVQTLKQELTPAMCGQGNTQKCVYQDPIPHGQLEVYRQGYR